MPGDRVEYNDGPNVKMVGIVVAMNLEDNEIFVRFDGHEDEWVFIDENLLTLIPRI